jgi:glycosyltransferase involved in cell wall biosynthesis
MADVIRNKMPDKEKETIRLKENVIHVWADDRNIQPSKEDEQNPFLEKWNLEGKFVLGYSGNMGRFHDLETIAEAAKKMKEEDQFRFLFIGEGFKKEWLINYVKVNGLSNCIIDTYVPREDLPFVLNTFDLGLVSLSQGQEGLSVPSKTFGLLSAGVPVVAIMNKSSEIALVIEEESCGIVVPPGDPAGLVENILALEQNRERLSEMKSNARKAVDSKYSLEKASQAYFELISQLMH